MTASEARPSDVLWFLFFFTLTLGSWVALFLFWRHVLRGYARTERHSLHPSPDQFPQEPFVLRYPCPCTFFHRPRQNDAPRGSVSSCRRPLHLF